MRSSAVVSRLRAGDDYAPAMTHQTGGAKWVQSAKGKTAFRVIRRAGQELKALKVQDSR